MEIMGLQIRKAYINFSANGVRDRKLFMNWKFMLISESKIATAKTIQCRGKLIFMI